MSIVFGIGQVVTIGTNGEKGKIINIVKPFGTYEMYKVQSLISGEIVTAARHELIKGIPDEEFNFQYLFQNEMEMDPSMNPSANLASPPSATISAPPLQVSTTPQPQVRNTDNSEPEMEDVDRFLDDIDVDEFVKAQENKNTLQKTLGHLKLLKMYLNKKGEIREPQNIPPNELNNLLTQFFLCIRKKNGDDYQPSCIRDMLGSFERHLKRHRYGTSLISAYEFSGAREALKSKQKELKKKGYGNKPHAAEPISNQDIDKLYKSGQLGNDTPMSLLNTLWLNNTIQFGMRGGGEEHRNLCWGDIELKYDNELNREYLVHNERQTKTRTGEDVRNVRSGQPRMYELPENKQRCPVTTYTIYSKKRPSNYCQPNHPFYLAKVTHTTNPKQEDQWFLRGPLGINKIKTLMKSMMERSGITVENKKLTNTSARKHLCQTLLDNNVSDEQAVFWTGHKNAQSLNNYRRVSNDKQCQVSKILCGVDNSVNNAGMHMSTSSTKHSSSTNIMHSAFKSIFEGSNISGGVFNINFYQQPSSPKVSRKRKMPVIWSDSDSDFE